MGEITRVLLAQIVHHPQMGFDAAILHAARDIWKAEFGASRSLIRARLKLFAPVLHLWGARSYRIACFERLHLHDPAVGYTRNDDAVAFMTQAMTIRHVLKEWNEERSKTERSKYLAVEMFNPWAECPFYEGSPCP